MEKYLKKILGVATYFYRKATAPVEHEITSINNLSSFVKAKANSFGIERLQLSFVNYDSETKKLSHSIDCFLKFDEALYLCNMILQQHLARLNKKERERCKQTGERYCKAIFTSTLGGIHEEKVRRKNLRSDGKAISRHFTISPGLKQDYVITCLQGAGNSNEKGLIVPDGNPDITIRVACSSSDLRKFALMIKSHIEGYISSQYAKGNYIRESSN